MKREVKIYEMDDSCIIKNLSPGWCLSWKFTVATTSRMPVDSQDQVKRKMIEMAANLAIL